MQVRAGLVRLARHRFLEGRFRRPRPLKHRPLKHRFLARHPLRRALTLAAGAALATAGLAAPAVQHAAAATLTDAVTSSWPGGFGAAITITNQGSSAINPWTLTFTFPASGEAVQGGWAGTWSKSGEQVTVNAASWNSSLAGHGGSVTIGFNGTDTGQDTAPTVLSVNGTACAND